MSRAVRPKPPIMIEPGEAAPAAEAPEIIFLPPVRPLKKQPKRHRQRMKFARFSAEEEAEFDRRATDAGLSDSAFIRAATIGKAGPRSKRAAPTAQSRLKADHVVAINRWGNLANQGIHSLHVIALEAPEAASRDRLADEVTAVHELLRTAVAALIETLAMVRGEPD